MRSAAHVLHWGASGARNIDVLYFMLGWARCRSDKKHPTTYYGELVFLHSVRSAGHVVCSDVSEVRHVEAPFFMLGRA
jgi:hypothetical protein